jgi:hypothetical protein
MSSMKLSRFASAHQISVSAPLVCVLESRRAGIATVFLAFSLILSGLSAPALAGEFTKIDVPFPGASGTFALGINPQGDIVGQYFDSSFVPHSFLLSHGTFSNIDPPGSSAPFLGLGTAMGINPQGDIAGSSVDSSGIGHGFLLRNGTYETINAPGATPPFGTGLSGINPQGDIVGFYEGSTGTDHGFLLSKGTFTNIDVPESLGAFPGSTIASGINPQGDIVGFYVDSSGTFHGFLLKKN